MAITVNRKPLTFWEKLYVPAIIGGLKVTLKHAANTLFRGKGRNARWTNGHDFLHGYSLFKVNLSQNKSRGRSTVC